MRYSAMALSWLEVSFGEHFKELEFLESEDMPMGNRKLTVLILSLQKAKEGLLLSLNMLHLLFLPYTKYCLKGLFNAS